MGRDKHEKERRSGGDGFVMLLTSVLDARAWRAMSLGARLLYIGLRRRFWKNNSNNGRIFLSQRDAAKEIGTHHNQIARWFRELQHYGFIVQTQGGSLGIDGKGKAPHWRLTELGYMKEPPTRDFDRWDGRKFQDLKLESRAGKSARGVPGSQHTTVLESRPLGRGSVPGSQHIQAPEGVPGSQHISRLPSASPSCASDPVERPAQRVIPISPELGSSALVNGKPIMGRPGRQRVTR